MLKINLAVKLILAYVLSFMGLCLLFGLCNNTPYDMTTLTWWLRKPIAILSFGPVIYLIEKEIKKKYARLHNP